jgi:hypothetical protein
MNGEIMAFRISSLRNTTGIFLPNKGQQQTTVVMQHMEMNMSEYTRLIDQIFYCFLSTIPNWKKTLVAHRRVSLDPCKDFVGILGRIV